MSIPKKHFEPKTWHNKIWFYVVALLINVIAFACIGAVYVANTKAYSEKLFDENVNRVENLNEASANAAYTYISSMGNKIDDMVSYIINNHLNKEETIQYLGASNTNPDRQVQLILSGTYRKTGEISFGDYSGVSIRKKNDESGEQITIENNILYGSGYYDIFRSFTDVNDENFKGLCSTPEFTDPDTKLKCFAVYRHIILNTKDNVDQLYTILLAINSKTALNAYNLQNVYEGQSTVLINPDGDYIIKNSDYRNVNFYDYIVNYNGLTLDKKTEIRDTIQAAAQEGESTTHLFYKNHKGDECIFAVTVMANNWYSVTCVPISSFNLDDDSVDYSFIILLLFGTLFLIDAIVIHLIGNAMRYNVATANRAQEEANQANQAKSRFLSTMTHELRTPLNAVIGLASLAGDSIEDPPVLRDYLKKIDVSSKLLLQIISDILDISAIESNKIKLNFSEFDITKLIASISTIYYDQCLTKGIEFSVVLKDIHAKTLIGDFVRVNQIILNYLSNAIKFTPDGGKITLKAEQIETMDQTVIMKFSISDTGCGISGKMKARLFNPFEREQGDEANKYSGTGLGLSITKSLVELMNGHVGAESTVGEGSCFWAEIPFTVTKEETCYHFTQIDNLKLLVAVSIMEEREYIGKILDDFSIDYCLVESAGEALKQLRAKRSIGESFDLCLIDRKMSDMTALDAIAQIRKDFDHQELRIVVLAYDIAEARQQCMSAGADFIFGKPVFQTELYHFLEGTVSNQASFVPNVKQDYDLSGNRILLVEDNEMNTEVAKKILEKAGATVEVAENGKIAYDLFVASTSGYYNLILMDIRMPVMNGYEATKMIRKSTHEQAKSIPILAMTADVFTEDVQRAHEVGMNEHLAKPIVREMLYETLEKYLR